MGDGFHLEITNGVVLRIYFDLSRIILSTNSCLGTANFL